MKKLYGRLEERSELIHDKAYWLEQAKESGQELTLELYLPDSSKSQWFFCGDLLEVICACGDSCGKHCGGYSPRNGKSGCCRYRRKCYYPTGQPFKLSPNGRLFKLKSEEKQ